MANVRDAADVDVTRREKEAASPTARGASPIPQLAVERQVRDIVTATVPHSRELPPRDTLADAVETVALQAGRIVGYCTSRGPGAIRSDAERAIVDNAALALVAALGLGYLVGRQLRR